MRCQAGTSNLLLLQPLKLNIDMENQPKQEKPKKSAETYRNALAVYLNLATNNVDTWLSKLLQSPADAIKRLRGENSADSQRQIFDSAIAHFFFLQWLYNQRNYFAKPNDASAIAGNYKKLVAWMEFLYDLRNYWSHTDHDPIALSEEVNETLLELYLQACADITTKIPERYKGTEGINLTKKRKDSKDGKDVYTIEEISTTLTITGTVFYACLFLDGGQVNNFLESMEQSCYTFEQLNARLEHRKKYPDEKYKEELIEPKKDFFYARDMYKYWQVRGHRASITVDAALDEKEACFGILEYLKRCPQEALPLLDIQPDKPDEAAEPDEAEKSGENKPKKERIILIDNQKYEIREKDKFFDWALAFWDEEMQRLSVAGWQWARHQTTEKIQTAKNELEQQASEAGRPYHFPRYHKVVFDIPQAPEERVNYRNDEHGFTYFLLRDEESDKATKAMFRYTRPDGKMAIGLMGGRLLCSVLEWYFYKFSSGAEDDKEKAEFWRNFFRACFAHVENTPRAAKPKPNVGKEQVEKRIVWLRKQYSCENIEKPHQQQQFILGTWNQIISYGREANLEHANNSKGRLGAKSGYQELLRYLSLMRNSVGERRTQAHASLVRILKQLGEGKSGKSYLSAIEDELKQLTGELQSLQNAKTVEALLSLCIQYREKMLATFEQKLAAGFNVDDWRPAYEMRWLGLSDARTCQAAQCASPATPKTPPQTNIVNVDSGSYSAVGLPRDVRHLTEDAWQTYLQNLNGGCVEKIHTHIYPSPNGCTLLIPAFYENATYSRLNKHSQNIHKHKLLYLIRRQDTVISHIAYKKWCSAMGETPQKLTLQSFDYQSQVFNVPVGEVWIRFYYRYFKQNRYQLPPTLSRRICDLLVSRNTMKVKKGDCIDFNNMTPCNKSILSPEEQLRRLLSAEEQVLPDDQKEELRKEYFERMSPIIFYPTPEAGKVYFDELLQSYAIGRRNMIDRIHKLEKRHKVNRKPDKRYTNFSMYADSLLQNGWISKEERKKLVNIRNAAFHGNIPDEQYIPQELVTTVNNNSQQRYFDFFGEGIALVDKILAKLPSPPKQNGTRKPAKRQYK
jgi:hypothetical protein